MKVCLVPPDTRPPTMAFPKRLVESLGHQPNLPPASALNQLNEPGSFAELKSWLLNTTQEADILILSLEQLCLGGMIPARRINDSLESALAKLDLLRELKRQTPGLRILAFGVIVRVAHGNDPVEEKPYFATYGNALRAYSEAFDRFEREPSPSHEQQLYHCYKALPATILNNWLETRKRNHLLHLEALELLKDGVLEHLCLTLDDTSTYGLAAADRRALEARTDQLGLWSQVDIYPGADEVPSTLIARALRPKKTAVYLHYSGSYGPQTGMLFEDRPAGELIKAQLRAANCKPASYEQADFILAVNTPGNKQAHSQPDFASVDTAERHLPAFIDFIEEQLALKKPVSIADIAYPNGAEKRFMGLLEKLDLSKLAGYSGWNTAGNSLGTAIAMAALYPLVTDPNAWTQLLFERLIDDYLYQALVRPAVDEALGGANPFDLGNDLEHAEALIGQKLEPLARALWQKHFDYLPYELDWRAPRLAWPRLFTLEPDFELKEKHV
ncbi:MAG: DUF4127 family protein [Trueperaceae bacterium]|nr:DUF4127 family protein [Trueperaceae bacterium]